MNPYRILSAIKRPLALLLAMFMLFMCIGCTEQDVSDALDLAGKVIDAVGESDHTTAPEAETDAESAMSEQTTEAADIIDEDGSYYSRDEVALYIHTYGKLPSNFITKSEAEDLGWEGGSVERYLDGAAIGGDKFGNREGLLPKADGRVYCECDIDTKGSAIRGSKRIVYSNDGLIFYTDDHYESFTQLYGEE